MPFWQWNVLYVSAGFWCISTAVSRWQSHVTRTEQKYSQIEREGLGIIFGVKHFYPFLFGRKFTLVTDNKPLAAIISPRKDIPAVAVEHIQRWAVRLSGLNYDV